MNKRRKNRPNLEHRELELEELGAILDRAKSALSAEDHDKLKAAVDTLAFLTRELEAKDVSINRLRKLLFGPSTEKTSQVIGDDTVGTTTGQKAKKKRKGHGRNAASAYRGAEKVKVPHGSLRRGDRCPDCTKGKVYLQSDPLRLVRVKGMAPLQATVYELEHLRCNLCGNLFGANAPSGVGDKKYDETAASMIGLLKYGCGLPFNRLERLQQGLGIPLPAATQWDLVAAASKLIAPAHDELIRQAAQGDVLHNDDTTMKILEVARQTQGEALSSDQGPDKRTGVFTSGIVSTGTGHKVAVFFTGRKHAGENLAAVLAQRSAELSQPIQMCDALSRNTTGEFKTILANCIAHARRRFADVASAFPDECRHVLELLGEVYRNDSVAREREISPEKRLHWHQTESGPVMEKLQHWLNEQLERHRVEPNSGLGEAIGYTLKHWSKLTLFLREPGAPLDNNICERALKKVILHRKNALFYKTENGARVGDIFMSMIHTAELCHADPFAYLVALQRHTNAVAQHPGEWMPWNYQDTLARLSAARDPPSA
jgi:hypothetical protein